MEFLRKANNLVASGSESDLAPPKSKSTTTTQISKLALPIDRSPARPTSPRERGRAVSSPRGARPKTATASPARRAAAPASKSATTESPRQRESGSPEALDASVPSHSPKSETEELVGETVPRTEEEIQRARMRALTLNNMACVFRR